MSNPSGQLDEAGIAEVLRRAQEIQHQTNLMLEPSPELEQYVRAAEEAGIHRDATMQALRERLALPIELFKPGEYVFAKSADGFFYVAVLIAIEGRKAKVEFLSGSEHHCDASEIRLFSLTPGQKVGYFSKSMGMWWEGQLTAFKREKKTVTVSLWGDSETLPLEKIRLPKEVQEIPMSMRARMWAIGIASALSGGLVGAILVRMLTG